MPETLHCIGNALLGSHGDMYYATAHVNSESAAKTDKSGEKCKIERRPVNYSSGMSA